MDMNLQPAAPTCRVSGRAFAPGDRVSSFLVRDSQTGELGRYDVDEEAAGSFEPPGGVICRWVRPYKPRTSEADAGRLMKMTAENLFLTLADPETEATEENTRLVQFLALMLERKRLLRLRGRSEDGTRLRYEHTGSHTIYEVPETEMGQEFFTQVHNQLSVLFGKSDELAESPAP